MTKFTSLLKAVCGISTKPALSDGTPVPISLQGWEPLAVVQDRRLCGGVFMRSGRSRMPSYRLVIWRTYRDRTGKENASTTLFRDQIDPALALMNLLAQRMPPQ
jgi:hypothetical protein